MKYIVLLTFLISIVAYPCNDKVKFKTGQEVKLIQKKYSGCANGTIMSHTTTDTGVEYMVETVCHMFMQHLNVDQDYLEAVTE